MRNHNRERPRKKDSTNEPRRTKPRMTPYARPHNKTDVEHISTEDRSHIVHKLIGDWDAHD